MKFLFTLFLLTFLSHYPTLRAQTTLPPPVHHITDWYTYCQHLLTLPELAKLDPQALYRALLGYGVPEEVARRVSGVGLWKHNGHNDRKD